MNNFSKQASQLAERAVDLDRRFQEKQAQLDTITDAIAARKNELRKLETTITELRIAVRGVYGIKGAKQG
jgi:uncharacterized coiled-coil DUF342 family protein